MILANKYLQIKFWHEKNGLRFIDDVELLEDKYKKFRNLSLTYAVRDGIISHCGEIDDNGISPRKELITLNSFVEPGQYQAATWEGCVVKISDKIAYIGRDIEDAIHLNFLDLPAKQKLLKMAQANDQTVMNTTVIMHNMVIDICKNSTPEKGISLSQKFFRQLKNLREFNTEQIYKHKRLDPFKNFSELVITLIFNLLYECYCGKQTWSTLEEKRSFSNTLINSFRSWLARYCNLDIIPSEFSNDISRDYANKKIFSDLANQDIYIQAILDYISGMSDRFAIKIFNELITY